MIKVEVIEIKSNLILDKNFFWLICSLAFKIYYIFEMEKELQTRVKQTLNLLCHLVINIFGY